MIWVHSETGEVYFVSGSWEVSNNDTATTRPQPRVKTDESGRILSLEGSLISSQLDAGRIAFEDYGRRNESEDPKTVIGMKFYTMTLGYSIPGFANKGDRLWEVRIMTPNGELRSIIWIDPVTGRTHLLTGPWLAQVNNATSEESTD